MPAPDDLAALAFLHAPEATLVLKDRVIRRANLAVRAVFAFRDSLDILAYYAIEKFTSTLLPAFPSSLKLPLCGLALWGGIAGRGFVG